MIDEIYARARYRDPLLIRMDYYRGYFYYILSLGTHPTAYVQLDNEKNKLYGKTMEELDYIQCHGDITYSESYLISEYMAKGDNRYFVKDSWVIGWDYNHAGDFDGGRYCDIQCKKWTVNEIVDECKCVIEQIIEINGCEGCL